MERSTLSRSASTCRVIARRRFARRARRSACAAALVGSMSMWAFIVDNARWPDGACYSSRQGSHS
jgi:hypothetical protein